MFSTKKLSTPKELNLLSKTIKKVVSCPLLRGTGNVQVLEKKNCPDSIWGLSNKTESILTRVPTICASDHALKKGGGGDQGISLKEDTVRQTEV